MKKIDIDELLQENNLELSLGGKVYVVADVPMTVMREVELISKNATNETWDTAIIAQLALFLGVKIDELKSIGVRAGTVALKAVQEFLTAEVNPTKRSNLKPS